jgi:restriction endonuclease S subunit
MVIDNYKPIIKINPEWEMVELGEVCELNPQKSELKDLSKVTTVSFVPMSEVNENNINFTPKETRRIEEVYTGYTYFKNNDVLLAKVTPCFENGKAGIANNLENGIGFGSSELYVLRCKEKILPMWVYLQVTSDTFRKEGKGKMSGTSGLQRIPKDFIYSYEIPLPTIEEQATIVSQIEAEQKMVESTKNLIVLFEQKIKVRIAEVWGEKE